MLWQKMRRRSVEPAGTSRGAVFAKDRNCLLAFCVPAEKWLFSDVPSCFQNGHVSPYVTERLQQFSEPLNRFSASNGESPRCSATAARFGRWPTDGALSALTAATCLNLSVPRRNRRRSVPVAPSGGADRSVRGCFYNIRRAIPGMDIFRR